MKIRTDFVTNSSSSSFIVAFPKDKLPASAGEMEALLFPGEFGRFKAPYGFMEDTTTRNVADRVYRDFINMQPADIRAIVEEFSHLDSFEGDTSPDQYIRENKHCWSSRDPINPRYDLGMKRVDHEDGTYHEYRETDYGLLQKDRREWVKGKLRVWKERYKDHVLYLFSYEDDDGEALLEHGDIFRNLPHIRISHH